MAGPSRVRSAAAAPRGGCSGEAELGRSLRAPRSYRPPAAAGELRPGEGRRRGRCRGPLPAQPLASPGEAAGRSRRCRLSRAREQPRGSPRTRPAAPPRFASGLVAALVRQAAQLSAQPGVCSR